MRYLLGIPSALITGYFAACKNRSTLFWGFFGFFAPLVALIVLLFMPHICPRCKQPLTSEQTRTGPCPHCGWRPEPLDRRPDHSETMDQA